MSPKILIVQGSEDLGGTVEGVVHSKLGELKYSCLPPQEHYILDQLGRHPEYGLVVIAGGQPQWLLNLVIRIRGNFPQVSIFVVNDKPFYASEVAEALKERRAADNITVFATKPWAVEGAVIFEFKIKEFVEQVQVSLTRQKLKMSR